MSESITRRLCITADVSQDEAVRAQFFQAFTAYGTVESVVFGGGGQYGSPNTTVCLQFQRLSSAEHLQADAVRSGKPWRVRYEAAVPVVGNRLLVSSGKAIERTATLMARVKASASVELKLCRLPGDRHHHQHNARAVADCWSALSQSVALVRSHGCGQNWYVLTFPGAPEATAFLNAHQSDLSAEEMYALHVGPAGSPLGDAMDALLCRRTVEELSEGGCLRGYVVETPSTAVCVVDAGVVKDNDQPLVVETRTNFLKVSTGDAVDIQITKVDAASGRVDGSLQRVSQGDARGSGTAVKKALLGVVDAKRGGGSVADILAKLKTGGPSASLREGTAAAPQRGMASRLFQAIQQQKRESADNTAAQPMERLCAYPKGLRTYTRILVRITQVAPDGLCAAGITVDEEPNPGSVFIPAHLIPSDHGEPWQRFAVPGERMAVALLYAVAIGGSAATRRCIASKLDADLRRCAAVEDQEKDLARPSDDDGNHKQPLAVGQALTVTRMHVISQEDIGSGGGSHFPSFIVKPAPGAPAAAFAEPLLLPAAGTSATSTVPPQALSVVVASISSDPSRGHYAVVEEAEAYRARAEEERRAEQQRRNAERLLVKQRLAAVLGEDAVRDIDDDASINPTKKSRTE